MRISLAVTAPLWLLAACSEAPAPVAKAETPSALPAGLWKTGSEVTQFKAMDKGKPAIPTPPGTKTQGEACVAASEGKKPNPALFAGTKDACIYKDFYLSAGTISGSLECTRPGLAGKVMLNVNGTYTADTLAANVDTVTYLSTDGDVQIASKITATRAGACS